MTDKARIGLWVDEELKNALQKMADNDDRSLNLYGCLSSGQHHICAGDPGGVRSIT